MQVPTRFCTIELVGGGCRMVVLIQVKLFVPRKVVAAIPIVVVYIQPQALPASHCSWTLCWFNGDVTPPNLCLKQDDRYSATTRSA
jgi:hypothetical protein